MKNPLDLAFEIHPIVAQMAPSEEQLPAVTERGRDVVVTAGAGTGKTRTLVARYLSLLAEGIELRRILAITFTKKAAREMRNRVRDEIRRYLSRPDISEPERRRWQSLYGALDAARIGTIHSFCTEILRAHPAEARLDPRFEVLDEAQMTILRRQSVDETLAWAADDREAAVLFRHWGDYRLRPLLDELLARRLEASEAIKHLADEILHDWEREVGRRQAECLNKLLASVQWQAAVETLRLYQALVSDDLMELQRQDVLRAIGTTESSTSARLASVARVGRINLRGGRQTAWPGGKPQLDEIKDALRSLRDLWRRNAGLLELTLGPGDQVLASLQPVLHATLSLACRRYDTVKRERNVLDFDDLEAGALALLDDDASVRERWQQEIQSILVDEFQDTNGRQRDLIARLNGDGGRLFVVGDAKQSIYRFRGADVTVFREERQGVERRGGAVFTLDTSYRAHRALIQGLNDLLRPMLGDDDDPARPWVEPFSALSHHREQAGPGFEAPYIELHLTIGSKGKGALELAAAALVDRIIDMVEGGARVIPDGYERPLDYGDIAILCRASSSFAPYENALEQAGVPFLTVAGRGFYGRPEIRDLLNAMQALADPTDDLALVGLLRSPAMGLSDAVLLSLRRRQEESHDKGPLWRLLQQGGAFPVEHAQVGERAIRLITELHARVGRTSAADILKAFLDATDYRAALIRAGQARGARNASKLLADAHASNLVGIGEFLDYVTNLRDTGAREGEARAAAEGAVQIMSVHAAKGLEFPVVAVGDITHQGRRQDSMLIQPELGVLLPLRHDEQDLPAIYCLGKVLEDDKEAAEADRLLYVAATRAREKLILNGCVSLGSGGKPGRLGDWMGRLAASHCLGLVDMQLDHDEEGMSAIELPLQVGSTPVSCTLYEPQYGPHRRLPKIEPGQETPVPLPPPLLGAIAPSLERIDQRALDQDRSPPQRVWRVVPGVARPTAPARVVGSLVHQALGAWLPPGPSLERWITARARAFGLADARQLRDAVRQCVKLVARFRDHPLYEEMAAAQRLLHEVPYSIIVDGEFETGIIDAVYLASGTWTIVEFKTDDVRSAAGYQELLASEDYLQQAQRYIVAAEQLLGQRPRCYLCWLNYRGAVRLDEV